jgi:hypothetical protein
LIFKGSGTVSGFSGFLMFPSSRTQNYTQLCVVGIEEEKCALYVSLRPCGASKASKAEQVEYANKINMPLLAFRGRARGEQGASKRGSLLALPVLARLGKSSSGWW